MLPIKSTEATSRIDRTSLMGTDSPGKLSFGHFGLNDSCKNPEEVSDSKW